jgi:hypothetical protein
LSPISQTASNEFSVVASSDDPADTICYTTDGSAPACASDGWHCAAGSLYVATNEITIDGTVTDPSSGQVTVRAASCPPCVQQLPPWGTVQQQYWLVAAAPAIDASSLADGGAGTRLASATIGATIHYTTDGTAPTCTTGTAVPSPSVIPSPDPSATLQAIACKAGYAPSTVSTFALGDASAPPVGGGDP